ITFWPARVTWRIKSHRAHRIIEAIPDGLSSAEPALHDWTAPSEHTEVAPRQRRRYCLLCVTGAAADSLSMFLERYLAALGDETVFIDVRGFRDPNLSCASHTASRTCQNSLATNMGRFFPPVRDSQASSVSGRKAAPNHQSGGDGPSSQQV